MYSGRLIHISGHPSATGRAWARESSPVKDQRSTTVQRKQLWYTGRCVSRIINSQLRDISKKDVARITKLDTEMFHNESWKPSYFRVKRSTSRVTETLPVPGVGLCTLVSAGFF